MVSFRKKDIDYDLLVKLVFSLINPSLLPSPCSSSSSSTTSQQPREKKEELLDAATGCILIFFPGVPEINLFLKFFQTHFQEAFHANGRIIHLISLHSNVSPEDQLKIFKTYPRGHLKIIASTNIAEASVTIPDCTVVIDCCRVKEMDYNHEMQAYSLVMKFASKDSLRQRKGRAGRVRKGSCYRMITKGTFEKLPDHSIPEILRLPLESVLLQILSMNLLLSLDEEKSNHQFVELSSQTIPPSCRYIFSKCPNIPQEENILTALQVLSSLQAVTSLSSASSSSQSTTTVLTSLGQLLARLPCHPKIGRLLVYGCLLDCVYPITCVAAAITCRSPFIMSNDSQVQQQVNNAKVNDIVLFFII
jgi:ATP-dependent RNA helicase DHX57